MKKLRLFHAIVTLLAISLGSCSHQLSNSNDKYVVMLSMDGFRWDYPERVETPNLDKIAKTGVRAKSLKPSFPTKTFPNHYSMATGLYPDHHGLVHNTFPDPETGRTYGIGIPETRGDKYFYGGEPIWITAEKQGIITGSYFWVGSDVDGLHPTYWKPYDQDFPYEQRIDSVIAWLQKPEDIRPHLITWYFPEPDITGHDEGPESEAIDSLIIELDRYVGIFLDKLEELPIYEDINVIVTSDHGMATISDDKVIQLNEILPDSIVITYSGSNPVFSIDVVDEYEALAMELLSANENLQVWRTGEVPERLNYGTNPRTLDIVVAAKLHWSVYINYERGYSSKGTHGFDNDELDMHAIFYAFGPDFKENATAPTFENVSLYALIAEILDLEPAETDGKTEQITPLLK